MKPTRPDRPKQQTPKEVLDALLRLIERKWYEGDRVSFLKDQKLLLKWVVLWPARHFFDAKGVSMPADRYRELMGKILLEAVAHQADNIRYRPAWLAQVVQSHFKIHGEEIYTEAKSARTLAEHALLILGKLPTSNQDAIVPEFAAASRLLDAKKRSLKPSRNGQLNLF